MKLPLGIGIARTSNNEIAFDIEDRISGSHFLRFTMTFEDFARCITGMASMDADGDFGEHAPIGYQREHKTENVDIAGISALTPPDTLQTHVAQALAPFTVDGWEARPGDVTNPHNRTGDRHARVVFTRYVHPETGHIWARP